MRAVAAKAKVSQANDGKTSRIQTRRSSGWKWAMWRSERAACAGLDRGLQWTLCRMPSGPSLVADEVGRRVGHGEDPDKTSCQPETPQNSMRMKVGLRRCRRTAGTYRKPEMCATISSRIATQDASEKNLYLDSVVIYRIDTIEPKANSDQNEHSTIAPCGPRVLRW